MNSYHCLGGCMHGLFESVVVRYLTLIPRLSHCPVCDLLVDNRRKGGVLAY